MPVVARIFIILLETIMYMLARLLSPPNEVRLFCLCSYLIFFIPVFGFAAILWTTRLKRNQQDIVAFAEYLLPLYMVNCLLLLVIRHSIVEALYVLTS